MQAATNTRATGGGGFSPAVVTNTATHQTLLLYAILTSYGVWHMLLHEGRYSSTKIEAGVLLMCIYTRIYISKVSCRHCIYNVLEI